MEMSRTQMWRMRPCNNKRMRPCNNKDKLNLMELPVELLVEILKRVPAKWVCHTRCVSKMLLSIVDSPSFVLLHSNFLLDPDSHLPPAPIQHILHLFNLTTRLSTLNSLHYDPSNPQGAQLNAGRVLQSFSPIHYIQCVVFCNLFGIQNRDNYALSFLINPLRGEVLRLPPCSPCIAQQICGPYYKVHSVSFGMGFDSVTSTYKILRYTVCCNPDDPTPKNCYVTQVLVLGTSEWRHVPTTLLPGMFFWSKGICAHGDMHWLFYTYCERDGIEGYVHILSFDFKKEDFFWIPNPYRLPEVRSQLELITFRGSMAIVDTTSGTNIEIWVMKDYKRKQWLLDYSISMDTLELDPQFEFSRAVCCEWEHGILFKDEASTVTLFLDLRGPVVTHNLFKYLIKGCVPDCRKLNSLNASLVSLKSYANSVEAEEPATYSSWTEGEASGKNLFYLRRH